MPRSSRLGILTVAVGLAAARLLDAAPAEPPTIVGSAMAAVRSGDRAARATEPVRYGDAALTLVASYPVRDGGLPHPTAAERHAELWALVVSTLPDDAVAMVRQLNVVTDGHDGTLAMVHRSTLDATTWVLSIDPAERDDVIVSTLVHEYAHILTLGRDDLQSVAATREGCDGRRLTIGCARPGSILADWHDAFWAGVNEPAPTGDHLVSAYAATSVHEDLAESFLSWVLEEVADPSAGVQARYAFFETRPELVAARDAVLAKLQQ